MVYDNINGGDFAKHFVQDLQVPPDMGVIEFSVGGEAHKLTKTTLKVSQ